MKKDLIGDLALRKIEIVDDASQETSEDREKGGDSNFTDHQGVVPEDLQKRFLLDSLMTADPVSLLIMCYELAKDSLKKAIEGIRSKDYESKYEGISKALKIFDLLIAVTEPNEVGKNLIRSYLFITQKITEADINKDCQLLEKVIGYISELEEAWSKAFKSGHNTP